jgi:hypothetical protein
MDKKKSLSEILREERNVAEQARKIATEEAGCCDFRDSRDYRGYIQDRSEELVRKYKKSNEK